MPTSIDNSTVKVSGRAGFDMKISIFGSSILSSYWNGAATYYRGMVKALFELGHEITFFEPTAYDRQAHADIATPSWAKVVIYAPTAEEVERLLEKAKQCDLLIKTSGVGALDEYLERAIVQAKTSSNLVAFWDVDAPSTLDRMHENDRDPFRSLVPSYDLILTYGGGPPVVQGYQQFGARACYPIYNGLDPRTHYPVKPSTKFAAELSFLGNRLPDREARVEEFFFRPAARLQPRPLLLAGNGWQDKPVPENVCYLGHLGTRDHNVFYSSARTVLNIARSSMAEYGFSPATRVFEATGAGACLITDAWTGIEEFFEPGCEILVAETGQQVAELVEGLSPDRARAIGAAGRSRCLRDHTYDHRAQQFDAIFSAVPSR
jgi:spore maturation protein CgeB